MHNSLKDRILESVDIVEVISDYVRLTRKGKDFVGLCPFHPDHKPSFTVSPSKRIFKCWPCGAGGNVIKFIERIERIDFKDALAKLAQRAGIEDRSSSEDREAARQRARLLEATIWAREFFQAGLHGSDAGAAALAYAHKRGLNDETVARHRIGFVPDGWNHLLSAAAERFTPEILRDAGLLAQSEQGRMYDRFRNRLIFPINDPIGRPIAFGGRTLGSGDEAKYLNGPETPLFNKSRVLFGFDLARPAIEKTRAAIVVEGYMDAVLLHQYGFTHTIATLGTSLTDSHAKLLRPLADKLYLCFDGDDAGYRAADRAVETSLRTKAEVRVVILPDDIDPADCVVNSGADEFNRFLSAAVDALEFKWQRTLAAFGGTDARSRRAAIDAFIDFVGKAAASGSLDPVEQGLLVNRLGDLLSIPSATIYELLDSSRKASRRRDASGSAIAATESQATAAAESATISPDGLPAGLVSTVEELLGLLVSDAACVGWIDDAFTDAISNFETWQRLYGICLDLHEECGEYSKADVHARCNDGDLLELFDQVLARVEGADATRPLFDAAINRLRAEMGLLRMSDLSTAVRQPASQEDAFIKLLAAAKEQGGLVLSPETMWKNAGPPSGVGGL